MGHHPELEVKPPIRAVPHFLEIFFLFFQVFQVKSNFFANNRHTIQSVLRGNFQQIFDEEFLSNEIKQKTGVAQGDKFSPLLFSLFIADLFFELKCKGLYVIFYADDLLLGSYSQGQLQQSLNNLNTYCSRNYLKINVKKTKCMKFRRGGCLAMKNSIYRKEKLSLLIPY